MSDSSEKDQNSPPSNDSPGDDKPKEPNQGTELLKQVEDQTEKEDKECAELLTRLRALSTEKRRQTLVGWVSEFDMKSEFDDSRFQDIPYTTEAGVEKLDSAKTTEKTDIPLENEQESEVRRFFVEQKKVSDLIETPKKQNTGYQYNPSVQTIDTTPKTIKNFSGNKSLVGGEVNFRRWHRSAIRVLEDKELSDSQKRRIIFKSLVGKADDAIEIYRHEPLSIILETLKSIFGKVDDVEDLRAEYHQRYQFDTETASEYLTELFLDASEIVSLGGFIVHDLSYELVSQFCRGTFDEELLSKLQWDSKYNRSYCVDVPNLFQQIRHVEARRTERRLRHRQSLRHKSATQVKSVSISNEQEKVSNQSQIHDIDQLSSRIDKLLEISQQARTTVKEESESVTDSRISEEVYSSLQQRVKQLEQGLQQKQSFNPLRSKKSQVPEKVVERNIFCYRCGEDNHYATHCNNEPNVPLVKKKSSERRSSRYSMSLNM